LIRQFIGIDVGENFLHLAIVHSPPRTLVFKLVVLEGLGAPVCATLAERITDAAPGLDAGTIALVDSPRWPRDLDYSRGTHKREPEPRGREIDAELRRIFRTLMAAPDGTTRRRGLSMFPTPPYEYFAQWAHDSKKPHLGAIAKELFRALLIGDGQARGFAPHGGTFTRFMLAGFATYRALERLGVQAFESYPDLQLRLSSPSTALPPKKQHAKALAERRNIVAFLAARLGLCEIPVLTNLDEADAAAMALAAACSARSDTLWVVSNPCEGRFMLALDNSQALRLGLSQ